MSKRAERNIQARYQRRQTKGLQRDSKANDDGSYLDNPDVTAVALLCSMLVYRGRAHRRRIARDNSDDK